MSNYSAIFAEKGLHSSYQRVRIYEYLVNSAGHLTADEIYLSLSPAIPTLSKATVYNTLHHLVDVGLVQELDFMGQEKRYEVTKPAHGHFQCDHCGKIVDFNVDLRSIQIDGLENYQILNQQVFYKGLCPVCQKEIRH